MRTAIPGRSQGFLLALLVLGSLVACSRRGSDSAPVTAAPQAVSSASANLTTSDSEQSLRLTSPRPGQALKSPLTVTGAAPGSWFFEATFPVTLSDGNGTVLARAPARAKGTWMTSNYVGFTATLVFATPTTAEGELLLQNDNPSGEAGKSRYVRVPVSFAAPANGQAAH